VFIVFLKGEIMQITIETKPGDVTIFRITGKMLIGEGDELLRKKINEFVEKGRKKIILDMKEVPYIDSVGLAEMVRSYTAVSRNDGEPIRLLNLRKRLSDLLSITKLISLFLVFDNEEEAIASFD